MVSCKFTFKKPNFMGNLIGAKTDVTPYNVIGLIKMTVIPFRKMMTSSNGNIIRVTGHLCGEFTGDRWILRTKASDAELWCFLWSASE